MAIKERVKHLVPRSVLGGYYLVMEFLAALFYGFPGKKVNCIGVTGTKGKSTTVYLTSKILEEAGMSVASVSSIEFRLNGTSEVNAFKMTLPSRLRLQNFLHQARKANVDYIVLEATSEGLAQHRVDFVHFIAAVFTNLAPEHIESHGSYQNYKKAKRRLFELLDPKGIAIINKDDREARYIAKAVRGKSIFYSFKERIVTIYTPLIGRFNQENALAAFTLCEALGVWQKTIKKTLASVSLIPGRLEEIKEGQGFRVFVDYAHNPSSLEAVLSAVSKLKTKHSKLIVIIGSQGGGRDRWKRPKMGKIAAAYADAVIITNEDPYQEDPKKIIEEVYRGAVSENRRSKSERVWKIYDRKEAIKTALKIARKNDILLITGKGSETVMETAQGKLAWNEREIVRQLLEKT